MSTPNGQHPADPNGAAKQATSTVLALDGWGPVLPEPAANGANGSEPEAALDADPIVEAAPNAPDWRESLRSRWTGEFQRPTLDPQLVRILAPVAAMAVAVVIAIRVGTVWRTTLVPAAPETAQPTPPDRMATIRRQLALAIDPTLTPVEPPRRAFLDSIRW